MEFFFEGGGGGGGTLRNRPKLKLKPKGYEKFRPS